MFSFRVTDTNWTQWQYSYVNMKQQQIKALQNLVGYADLSLLVPQTLSMLLLEHKTSHLSTQHWLRYNTVLIQMPNITVKYCTILNPATLLSTTGDKVPDDCVALTNHLCSSRLDLKDEPLYNPELIINYLYYPKMDNNKVGYAVVENSMVVKSEALLSHLSAQAAELFALIEECKLANNKSVPIYTDSVCVCI